MTEGKLTEGDIMDPEVIGKIMAKLYSTKPDIKPYVTSCCEQTTSDLSFWDVLYDPDETPAENRCATCGRIITPNVKETKGIE